MIPYYKYNSWWVDTPTGSIEFPSDCEAWEFITNYIGA